MKTSSKQTARFRVGDRVRFPFGKYSLSGVVKEDRGPIGFQGRRLYRVRVPMDLDGPEDYTIPENELETAAKRDPVEEAPGKEEIIKYLKNGGLVAMLMSNSSGGENQPRVWLGRDQLGNVTHTFSADRGLVGGETIPFWSLFDNERIFLPKKDQVVAFLCSFGLSPAEAGEVIRAVGTAPGPGDRKHSGR
jgi:hypothetical protein